MLFPIVQDFFFLLVWQLCRCASFPSHPTHQIFSCKPWSPSDVSCSTNFSTFKSLSFAIGSLLASKPAFCIICWTFPVCPSYVYFKFPMTGTQESNFASVPCVFGAIFQDACPYISWLKLHCCFNTYSSWVAQWLKKKEKEKKFHLPVQEMQVQSLYWEDFLEKEMATHSSILAWKAPWTEEPGGLQSTESQKSQTWLSGWTHIHRHTYTCIHAQHILQILVL